MIPCLLIIVFSLFGIGIGHSRLIDPVSSSLKFVAAVDGKSYYTEQTTMNWTAGGELCESFEMKLATIRSQSEFDALNSKFNILKSDAYWTSGRDSYLPRQFSWNQTEDAIPENLPYKITGYGYVYQTCLTFASRANNASFLAFGPCSLPNRYVLCEA